MPFSVGAAVPLEQGWDRGTPPIIAAGGVPRWLSEYFYTAVLETVEASGERPMRRVPTRRKRDSSLNPSHEKRSDRMREIVCAQTRWKWVAIDINLDSQDTGPLRGQYPSSSTKIFCLLITVTSFVFVFRKLWFFDIVVSRKTTVPNRAIYFTGENTQQGVESGGIL